MGVWFELVISGDDYYESQPVVDHVHVTTDDFLIADMRDAVKTKCAPDLNYLASNRLEVYPPETKVPIPAGTDRCDPQLTVASYLLEGKGQRFIVVAPAKQQQQKLCGKWSRACRSVSPLRYHQNLIFYDQNWILIHPMANSFATSVCR